MWRFILVETCREITRSNSEVVEWPGRKPVLVYGGKQVVLDCGK